MRPRTNLLFLFTDQQRYDTLACYGNDFVQTPNLNRLAKESVVFDRAYVTQPICTPARSSIMTGLFPHATGCTQNNIPLRAEIPTLAEMLTSASGRPSDYRRAYIGKWHLGDEVMAQHGFETWISLMDRYRQHYTNPEYRSVMSDYHHYLIAQGYEPDKDHQGARIFGRERAARMPEEHTKARFVGRETARFLREIGERPFVAYANFFSPHPPFIGPFDEMYRPDEVPVGPTFRQRPPQDAALCNRQQAEVYFGAHSLQGIDLRSEIGWRAVKSRYLGLITLVDRAVGEILQALDETGLWENTIVVFTSDHGDMMGDHAMFQKGPMYDGSTRVPLLLRMPGVDPESRRILAPVSQIDLVPTLLELLGQPVPEGLHGQSWAIDLRGGDWTDRDVIIESIVTGRRQVSSWLTFEDELPDLEWERAAGLWRSIISPDGYKLNLHPVDQCELYDLDRDPHERENLFDEPQHRPRIRDMATRLKFWRARTGDTAPLPAL